MHWQFVARQVVPNLDSCDHFDNLSWDFFTLMMWHSSTMLGASFCVLWFCRSLKQTSSSAAQTSLGVQCFRETKIDLIQSLGQTSMSGHACPRVICASDALPLIVAWWILKECCTVHSEVLVQPWLSMLSPSCFVQSHSIVCSYDCWIFGVGRYQMRYVRYVQQQPSGLELFQLMLTGILFVLPIN